MLGRISIFFSYVINKRVGVSFYAIFFILLCSVSAPVYAELFERITKIRPHAVKSFDFYETYTAIGQSIFQNSKSYYASRKGRVDYLSDKQGKKVEKGDMLIIIDKSISENIKFAADADLHRAQSSYKRDIKLHDKKVINEESLIESKAALAESKRKYAESIKIYNDMYITAPFDGIIGTINVHLDQEVSEGDFLLTIYEQGKSEVIVNLPHTLYAKVNHDSIVKIIDLNQEEIICSIDSVSPYVSNVGTIPVRIDIPPYAAILHGNFLDVQFIYNRHKAIAIPEKAVLKNNKGSYVYKITDDKLVKQTYVQLGTRTGDMIEITEGNIEINDMIVLDGIVKVQDGDKVELLSESSET